MKIKLRFSDENLEERENKDFEGGEDDEAETFVLRLYSLKKKKSKNTKINNK
jgi:hypothetical protein